jgi:putative heme-binding domain-containing protein
VHDVLIAQFPTTAPTATYLGCTNQTEPDAACAVTMMTHHMAKVLAYTGEPDVIGKVLAVMPPGNEDQPGQIDYVYALRVIDRGWSAAEVKTVIDWFAKASKWRGGSTFAGHLNNVFDAVIDAFTQEQKQAAYDAAPLFAPLTPTEVASAGTGRGGGRGGGAGAAGPPAGAGTPPPGTPPTGPPAVAGATPPATTPPGGGRGGGGGRGRGGPPALTRNVPLDKQERYDNLVFPRGGGPGVLTGRGGGPNVDNGRKAFTASCAQCHRVDTVGRAYGPDLSNLLTMPRRDILRAIFFPSETVDPKFETTVIVTRDKQTIRGLVVSESGQNVTLKTADAVEPVVVQKSRIATRTKEKTSIMPEDLPDTVGDNTIRDIVAFLMTPRK